MSRLESTSRDRLVQAWFDSTSDAVIFVDPGGAIRDWNPAALAFFELSAEEFSQSEQVHWAIGQGLPLGEQSFDPADKKRVSHSLIYRRPGGDQVLFDRVAITVEIEGECWLVLVLSASLRQNLEYSELYRLSREDSLSGLLNRRGFQSELESNLDRGLALAIVDVDFFKSANDQFGHQQGDELIRWLAQKLRTAFPDAVCLGRLGGDEFGVVLEYAPPNQIESTFNGLCQSIAEDEKSWHDGGTTISVGVAIAEQPIESPRELLALADKSMHQSKQNGRNQVTVKLVAEDLGS